MLILQRKFDELLENKKLRLALVGMSNSGKSTSSKVLKEEAGFEVFEVDEAINSALGIRSMTEAAEWMGYPFDEKYTENKRKYLELEEANTRVEIPLESNFVLDTTGSIIYGSQNLQNWLSQEFLIVGLRASSEILTQLIDDYFTNPKTVIWGSEFEQRTDESGKEALCRCYPQLLENRSVLYEQLSDVQVPAELARSPSLTAESFLSAIRNQLD